MTQQLELMQVVGEQETDMETGRPRFTTIDDLIDLAGKLVDGLNKLGSFKHPFDVRRGEKHARKRNEK